MSFYVNNKALLSERGFFCVSALDWGLWYYVKWNFSIERYDVDKKEYNVRDELIGRVVVFGVVFVIIFFALRFYISSNIKSEDDYLQDAIEEVAFLENNQASWAELCNAIQGVTIRATKLKNSDIYQKYKTKYDAKKCDPLQQ